MTCTICRRQGKATKAVRFTLVNLGYCARCADVVDRYRKEMGWQELEWRTKP